MNEDPHELYFEIKLRDGTGRIHAVLSHPIDRKAAYMGSRIADDMRAGLLFNPHAGTTPFEQTVEILQVREFRRKLLVETARQACHRLADFLEDREGWHGADRQELTEKAAKEA